MGHVVVDILQMYHKVDVMGMCYLRCITGYMM